MILYGTFWMHINAKTPGTLIKDCSTSKSAESGVVKERGGGMNLSIRKLS